MPKPFSDKEASAWTAIIPAAGAGTRLGSKEPKLFYSMLGKPLFEWVLDRLKPYCAKFIFIVAPGVDSRLGPILEDLLPEKTDLLVQEKPLGMGHAVNLAQKTVRTPNCMVMWVDQIALSRQTIEESLALTREHPHAKLVLPTVHRQKPYIRFERNPNGRITQVHQAREEGNIFAAGENDCGIFFFRSAALFAALREAGDQALKGKKTGEINLLPVIPWLDKNPGDVITLNIADEQESVGLNTPDDARVLEKILRHRI